MAEYAETSDGQFSDTSYAYQEALPLVPAGQVIDLDAIVAGLNLA